MPYKDPAKKRAANARWQKKSSCVCGKPKARQSVQCRSCSDRAARRFDRDEALHLYQDERLSFAEIGRRLGVHAGVISAACYALGAEKRPQQLGDHQRPQIASRRPSKHAFDHDEAVRLFSVEKMTYAAIADRLKVTEKSIREVCYKAGVSSPRERKRGQTTSDQQLVAMFTKLIVHDPAIPSDESCAKCGGDRNVDRSMTYAPGCAVIDAFCSTECAREWHGNPIPHRSTHPNYEEAVA